MNKFDVLNKLKELSFSKNDFIVVGDAALVLQDIIIECSIISLSCSSAVYNKIKWDEITSSLNIKTKVYDAFDISVKFCKKEQIILLFSYKVSNIEFCYFMKKIENKKSDRKLLRQLEYLICQSNNFYWYEKNLKEEGLQFIAGVDEVGRGPLVGPVVAACVVLPKKFCLDGLTDSKKLSEKRRLYFYEEIKKQALGIGIGIISNEVIDEINIYEATKKAMMEAILQCRKKVKIEHVLIDAMPLKLDIPTTSIIKGDLLSVTISAASVIAKVTRDRMLVELDKKYPMYDFKNNKGYPTKKHLEAISLYGVLKEHRKSYGPVREYLDNKNSEI